MRRPLALSAFASILVACAGGDDPGASTADTGEVVDSGVLDVADTSLPDAHDVGGDTNDSGTDSGGDSGTDTADSTVTDSVGETTSETGTDAADAADTRDATADTLDTGVDSGVDSGSDTRDSGVDAGADSGVDSGSDTGVDSGTDTGSDTGVDAAADTHDAADVVVDTGTPYRHTITIDGTNDFTASEKFTTTSGSFDAYVTWDASALYVGYNGPDISATTPSAGSKWVLAYLDVGTGGSSTGQTYNTETPAFPTGLRPSFYLRWKVADSTTDHLTSLEQFTGSSWTTVASAALSHSRSGNFVEFAIPLSAIGMPATVSLVTFMLNETGGAEACFAGLYSGNFTDGYHATLNVTKWLYADFASPLFPDDATRARP